MALLQAADTVDRAERAWTASELHKILNGPHTRATSDCFVAEAYGGAPAGFAALEPWVGTPGAQKVVVHGVVHPDWRRCGIGAGLMLAAEARAAEIMSTLPGGAGLPQHLDAFCRSFQNDAAALFESRGMKPVRYFFGMQRDLRAALPDAVAPEGIVIRTYRAENSAPALSAFNDAFGDHWEFQVITPELWQHDFVGVPYFRPDLWFLAWDGDEIVGFTFNLVDLPYTERVGRREGIVDKVGVRRPWRKRGLGAALLAHSLRALREAGMDFAFLGVDADSLTGAVRLYERAGFRELRRTVVYRKVLTR